MRSPLSLVLALLVTSSLAAPGTKCKKAVCNADNCLRAVRATSAKPFASSASADCSSFMRKTVTPCAVTTTRTTTVTVTASPANVTVTTVLPQTQLNTILQTITSAVATIEDTVTLIQPSQVIVYNTRINPVTVTAPAAQRRAVANLAPLPDLPGPLDRLEARALSTAGTCPASTGSPTSVPTYASACSGTARYSSACSCAGFTGVVTTLTPVTNTATSTSTVTVTPTRLNTLALSSIVPVTVVQTRVVPTTFVTTDATLIVPSLYTVTTDIVVPTTVTVAPPVCSSYKFVVTSSGLAGQFITGDQDQDINRYGFVVTGGDAASAISFVIRPDATVYGNGLDRWITRAEIFYYVLQSPDANANSYNVDNVYCAIRAGNLAYPGAVGSLSCTAGGHSINFYSCPQTGVYLLQGTAENSAGYGDCTQFDVAAVPACS